MPPKRSREDTSRVSPVRPRSKSCVSQLLSIMAIPEVFASEEDYRRYIELFHGRELIARRRFNLSTLTATGLEFEVRLIKCRL